jgi:iron-sulfur cluster assembly accessory protein
MINLTPAAATQIRDAANQSGAENMALRVAAKINEAGMLEFGMGFDNERADDQIIDSQGVTMLVSKHSLDLLEDVTLDFGEIGPGQEGFIFTKPASPAPGGGCGGGSCGGGGCGGGSCG